MYYQGTEQNFEVSSSVAFALSQEFPSNLYISI